MAPLYFMLRRSHGITEELEVGPNGLLTKDQLKYSLDKCSTTGCFQFYAAPKGPIHGLLEHKSGLWQAGFDDSSKDQLKQLKKIEGSKPGLTNFAPTCMYDLKRMGSVLELIGVFL
ncbi:hypothetical protein VP01_2736g1 [Puccinia sorghi]|uniref:Uncharacterized protein n=1 Tax=Puccinia sorghi TaxID=27349 RepID=A0A0L6V358_9BASI|nr:hypothetical protein VP01_2736g1 [Puccinia sorghi]